MSNPQGLTRRRFAFVSAGLSGFAPFVNHNSLMLGAPLPRKTVPDKTVVLTFDDAVKSHRTNVAPLLKQLGFGATFFVTHSWMDDRENFMNWQEIAEIHRMGFEIGNHSWTHDSFSIPRKAARLAGELALVELQLKKVGVPRPVSFAYCGNAFGPEAVKVLMDRGYKFARRGLSPEIAYEYGMNQLGPTYNPLRHHPLVIPSTGMPDPAWTAEVFTRMLDMASGGTIVVVVFHGVPDLAHPWCHTPPEKFWNYMTLLKERGARVLALRDLEEYTDLDKPPADPVVSARCPEIKSACHVLPVEVEATQKDLDFWLENMIHYHRFSMAEAARVCGLPENEVKKRAPRLKPDTWMQRAGQAKKLRVLPYPGGRHPRIGFLEGAFDPMRGTKASVFLPWDIESYVVVDLPEAIFSNLGLLFLAHTHVPTIWNDRNIVIENVDWKRLENGRLEFRRYLPNGIAFGASVEPRERDVAMELWLRNVTYYQLSGLRTQVCVMLKGARGFKAQTMENKILRKPVAAARAANGGRWILTSWERSRVWGNPSVPCMHSDPVLPDCPPGGFVSVRGRLWFYEGTQIEAELERAGASD